VTAGVVGRKRGGQSRVRGPAGGVGADPRLVADRGTRAAVGRPMRSLGGLCVWLQRHGRSYRLRLKGNVLADIGHGDETTTGTLAGGVTQRDLTGVASRQDAVVLGTPQPVSRIAAPGYRPRDRRHRPSARTSRHRSDAGTSPLGLIAQRTQSGNRLAIEVQFGGVLQAPHDRMRACVLWRCASRVSSQSLPAAPNNR
jgi:hypothetical protein